MSTTAWDVEPGHELRHLRAIHPFPEEFREICRSLDLHQSLLHQLQDPGFAPGFNHVVISAAEVFMAMGLGAPVSVGEWARLNFLPALLGNLVGGLIFVTLLGYVQAHSPRRSEQRMRGVFRRRELHH